jgi:hypothetical protein
VRYMHLASTLEKFLRILVHQVKTAKTDCFNQISGVSLGRAAQFVLDRGLDSDLGRLGNTANCGRRVELIGRSGCFRSRRGLIALIFTPWGINTQVALPPKNLTPAKPNISQCRGPALRHQSAVRPYS